MPQWIILAQPLAGRRRSSSSTIRKGKASELAFFPPVGAGVVAEITDCDLSLVGIRETIRAMNFR